MTSWSQFCSRSARTVLSWVFSFALWTLWLALVAALAFQLYIASANELALPEPVLRQLEARLAEAGLRATFTRTSFDPTGRVLIENVRLMLPGFDEPVVTARSVFVQLNPWFLAVGKIDPWEVRVVDLSAAVPAMLSGSGQSEELIQHLDAVLEPSRQAIDIREFSARLAGIDVSAHGKLAFARSAPRAPADKTVADFLKQRFAPFCRQALAFKAQVAQFEAPALRLEFAPSESGAAALRAFALARHAKLDLPVAFEAADLRASAHVLLFGDEPFSQIDVSAGELRVADTTARGVAAQIVGRFRLDGTRVELREIAATADSIVSAGVETSGVAVQVFPRPLPRLEATGTAHLLGAPLAFRTEADLGERTAAVQFRGEISPRVLDVISARVGTDVRQFFDFKSITADRAEARFGPGWKFEKLTARVRVPWMNSYGVPMEDGHATVELDPERFYGTDAYARVGDNFARGSYEHNLKTHQYRFLLEGRLRPLAISEWFREWWPNFFNQLQFPVTPPWASVDVAGFWRDSRYSTVFVFADAPQPVIRGVAFDRVRTRIFIRPTFFDGLELLAQRGPGGASGRFAYIADPETHDWQSLELGLDSTLDLGVAAQLLGPAGAKALAPFQLAAPPTLKIRGLFSAPTAPGGENDKLHIVAHTTGDFRYYRFPLQDVSFTAALDHDEVLLDDVTATFAGGRVGARARVSGSGAQRRLGFDVTLGDASLGQVASALAEFFAAQKNLPSTPPGKFVQEKANVRLDFGASAEGRYDDPMSYQGKGNAALHGAEIGEVPLLGSLSELFKFTALHFNDARANFKIEGPRLVFSEVALRGANSAIDAHGTYTVDRRELDFNAKIFPFQESGSLIKSVVGAVLTPLSNAFEVKLTGSIVKPEWAFVMGPTNFLRSLAPGDSTAKPEAGGDDQAPKPSAGAPETAAPVPGKS